MGFAHRDVEERLASYRHVALGAELPSGVPLLLEETDCLGEVKSRGHDAEA